LVTTITIAEFETKKPIWSGTSGKPREDLVRYDAKEDDVVDDKCDNNATENDDEDYLEVYNENLGSFLKEAVSNDTRVAKEELHYYNETSNKRSVILLKIGKKVDEISEVLARERGNDEDKVKPEVENLKNELVPALADYVGQEESDNELPAINAVAEFQSNNETWSDVRVKSGKDLICFNVEEIADEDDMVCAILKDDATGNHDEEYTDDAGENLDASDKLPIGKDTKKEQHDYDETSGKEADDHFKIVRTLLGNQETSDGGLAKDSEAVLEDFKGTAGRENDDQGSQSRENDDKRSLGKENDDKRASIDETDDHSITDEEVLENDEEQTINNEVSVYVGVKYDLKERDEDGKHNKTLKVMYEDLDDVLEVSEDDGACNEEKEIKDKESSHEVTENEQVLDDYEVSTARVTDDQPSFNENEEHVGKKGNLENDVEAPNENCEDEVKNSDGYQSQEPEVIKLLFKGSFSENSGEIIENINKLNKICSGNDKMDGYEDFPSPEDQSCMDISMLEIPVENKNVDLDGALNVEESDTVNEKFEGQTKLSSKPFILRTGSELKKLVYTGIRKVVSNTSRNSKICCVTVLKHEFDERLKLKVDGVNMLVTVTSLQMAQLDDISVDDLELDAQLICDVKRSHNNYNLFSSFPWRPGNHRCWIYIFTIIDLVLLLISVVCGLFANTVKAKLEAEEFEEELYRGKPVVRNWKQSIAHLFPVQLTRPVEYETKVYEELPDDSVVTNVAYKSVMYDAVVYEELLDESMVETEAYEAVVYDEMSVFHTSEVLLLYPSCPDVAQYKLPAVENLLPDVALDELPVVKKLYPDVGLDELPAVEDLSASVDTTGSAMPYYLVSPVIRQRYQLLVSRGKITR